MTAGTIAAWVDALTFNRAWDEQRDAPRLRRAFQVLAATARDWPAPADLVASLPPVEHRLALPSRPVSPEHAQANIDRIQRMLRGEGE